MDSLFLHVSPAVIQEFAAGCLTIIIALTYAFSKRFINYIDSMDRRLKHIELQRLTELEIKCARHEKEVR